MPVVEKTSDHRYIFFCPGCGNYHWFQTEGDPKWSWNNDHDRPTLSPSVHVPGKCHFYMRNGRIEYLPDCDHKLAGKTVDMVDVNQ